MTDVADTSRAESRELEAEESMKEKTAETEAASTTADEASTSTTAAPESAAESSASETPPTPEETAPSAEGADPISTTAPVSEEAPASAPSEGLASDAAASATASASADEAAPMSTERPESSEATTAAAESGSTVSADPPSPPEQAAAQPPSAETEQGEATAAEPAADAEAQKPAAEELRPEVQRFLQAMETRTPVQGKVIGWNKGGFHVVVDGIPAFCPKSQIELGNPRKASTYIDREFDFQVIEVKEQGKRIVVSRSELVREQREQILQSLRDHQRSGEPITGRVSSLTDFGAFVDVGAGVEGLVHVTALSRQRVESPRDFVKIGDEVKVKVLKIEKGGERISLSMKALEPDPWKGLADRYPIGSRHEGKILRKADFGLFVEVEPGLEGLVHTSQLPLGKTLEDSSMEEGADVEVWVRDADQQRRRLALAMREVAENDPWGDISDRYEEGQAVQGTVEQVAKFGVFVMLEPGLTALLPFSNLSLPAGSVANRMYRPGQEIEAQIAEIDAKRKRMSLAPVGTKLEGTKADLKEFKQKQKKEEPGLNAMAAAFAKLERD